MSAASLARPVTRVLVANRGEIALRIIRACDALGIESVAIYSDADRTSLHVAAATQAVRIGPEDARESYLDVDRVLAAARESGADAVHPGYGFLSENAEFVERVVAAGLTFVGPSAAAMRALGDKARAKAIAADAQVPTIEEWAPDEVPDSAYPVLVKAAAGGGGRGMRRVDAASELPGALESARREALAGFGDDTLIVERLVTGARHVEVQLLADEHGTALYVGDRDCSLQRRHQKVIEEAPAPELPHGTRVAMGEATVRLARAASYSGAGTAEFLVESDGRFSFLELNARLQVEHPVTEEAFGIDLAQWQLRIARGEQLTVRQEQLSARAHSIEARVYAEDPVTFLPTGGELVQLELPSGSGIRVEHALHQGMLVSLAYDPMLAKVIATGSTREEARRRLIAALQRMVVLGTTTNVALLLHALELPTFVAATHDVATLEASPLDEASLEVPPAVLAAARSQRTRGSAHDPATGSRDPFLVGAGWRQAGLAAAGADEARPASAVAGRVVTAERGDRLWISCSGITWDVPRSTIAPAASTAGAASTHGGHASLTAPMPGTVIKAALAGTTVSAGDTVVVLEAMKMENSISAPFDGTLEQVAVGVGDLVTKGTLLAELVR